MNLNLISTIAIITLALAIGVVLWSLYEIQSQNDNDKEKLLKERRKRYDNRKNKKSKKIC